MKKTLSVLLAMGFSVANAAVIDFQPLEHNDATNTNHGFQYTEDGFQLDEVSAQYGLHTFGTQEGRYSGSTAMFNDTVGGITRLSKIGGGLFDLFSIDLAELNGPSVASITFTTNGGHTQTFTIDGIAFAAQTFLFDSGFLGVNFVTWTQDSPYHQFDNIVTDQVPEPASLALIAAGLAGLGLARRKARAS